MKGAIPFQVPSPLTISDPNTRKVVDALHQNLLALYGHGRPEHSALLMGTASKLGIVAYDGGRPYYKNAKDRAAGTDQTGDYGTSDVGTTKWVSGTWTADGAAVGTHDIGSLQVPANAYIVSAWFDVLTAFTGPGASISIGHADDAAGIFAVTGIAGFTSGKHAGIPNGTAGTFAAKTTYVRAIRATVSGAAVTAGKLKLFIEYAVSE